MARESYRPPPETLECRTNLAQLVKSLSASPFQKGWWVSEQPRESGAEPSASRPLRIRIRRKTQRRLRAVLNPITTLTYSGEFASRNLWSVLLADLGSLRSSDLADVQSFE